MASIKFEISINSKAFDALMNAKQALEFCANLKYDHRVWLSDDVQSIAENALKKITALQSGDFKVANEPT